MKTIRTRFAPSPTGFIHVGNLRSALYTYLIAKSQDGKFLLRIEDTDQNRYVEGAVDVIYDTLRKCGLNWDEGPDVGGEYGPYIQSERMDGYKKYALELVEKDEAYPCFCSEERISKLREEANAKKETFFYDGHCKDISKEEAKERMENEPYVIRQKTPTEGETSFTCQVYGTITIQNDQIEDQILLKTDGYPTYNFANVVDDHLMDITHVVRGNEYLTSTPKYTLLYKAFGWEEPNYVHLPHVIKEGGKKLSKREGDAYFSDFVDKGYLPKAIVNYLALLGWSPSNEQEIFSLKELEEVFTISRINNSPSIFDVKKLDWINSHYIKELTSDELYALALPHLEKQYDLSDKTEQWIRQLVELYQSRLSYVSQIVEEVEVFFNKELNSSEEAKEFMKAEGINNTLKVFNTKIEEITDWDEENIKAAINNTKKEANVKGKMLFMPIRIASTSQMHGADLISSIKLFGKDRILENLSKYL